MDDSGDVNSRHFCRERSRERRRAADTLRRRRGLFMLKSLDTITGTTSTVSILSRTVRSFFFTKRRLPGKGRHCASAPRKLAVRAAPIVKPSCFKSIRRLPGTIKVGGRAKQRFIPPKPVGWAYSNTAKSSGSRAFPLCVDQYCVFRTNSPAGFSPDT